MGLNKFMAKNEFENEFEIEECQEKIRKMLEIWNGKDKEIKTRQKAFFDKNNNDMKYFLTQELNFIEDSDGKNTNYRFKNDNYTYEIKIQDNGFEANNYVAFKLNRNELGEYKFRSDLKGDIEFQKNDWELKPSGWSESTEYELKRTDSAKAQNTKNYWNKELIKVEKVYSDNLEVFNNIKDLSEKEIFEISTEFQESYSGEIIAYEDLKQFIKEKLEKLF